MVSPRSRQARDVETGLLMASSPDSTSESDGDLQLRGPLKPIAETTPTERITGILAIVATGTALAAIILESSTVVTVAGILAMITGPYAYWQQTKLTDLRTLKETNRVVAAEVRRLGEENERLGTNINQLTATVDDLQDLQKALEIISGSQGMSVAELERQLEENKVILSKMRKSTKGRILQNLISIIVRGDKNMDDKIDNAEVDLVIKNLRKIGGVTIHEDRLRACIVGKSVDSIIDVAQNMLQSDMPADQRIFDIPEDQDN